MKRNKTMKKNIIIGSRGSTLALAQSEYVKQQLEKNYKGCKFFIEVIITSGDKDLKSNWENSNKSLKSYFTKEIEMALLKKKIDVAVHSMKDMPIVSTKELICGAIPDREDVRDVIISKNNLSLSTLPKGSKIGTSSFRRSMNIKSLRPDIKIKHLRGNINTRLEKLDNEEYDAIILAAAGLKRVGLEERITEYLDGTTFTPAPAQGALYVQCRKEDEFSRNMLKSIHNEKVAKIVEIEREFSRIFDGGCHTPMGCFSKVLNNNKIEFYAMYSKDDEIYRTQITDNIEKGKEIAVMAAFQIKEQIRKNSKNDK